MQQRYALGRYAAAAVRRHPRSRAVLTGQLLLGEPVRILGGRGRFVEGYFPITGQSGYVRTDQLVLTDEATYTDQVERPYLTLDHRGDLMFADRSVPLNFGARLPEFDGLHGRLSGEGYLYSGSVLDLRTAAVQSEDHLIVLARRWLHVAEFVGGRSPAGVGAAELVHLLLSLCGLRIPLSVGGMQQCGDPVDFTVQCRVGDLAFFDGPAGRLSHVGLVMPDSMVLHVDACVRLDPLDHRGIYSGTHRGYGYSLRIVKRVLNWHDSNPGPLQERYRLPVQPDSQLSIF